MRIYIFKVAQFAHNAIETEDWSSTAAAQRLAEGPVGPEY